MNKIEMHKAVMKRFETMINTADANMPKSLWLTMLPSIPLHHRHLFTAAKVIYRLFIGCVKVSLMSNVN